MGDGSEKQQAERRPALPLTLRQMIAQSVEADPITIRDRETFELKGWEYPRFRPKRRKA